MTGGSTPRPGHSVTQEGARSAAERLVFFSDAVVAIALTLLAIELPVPRGATGSALLDSLGEGFPEYLAFGISFAVIFLLWNGHHRLYRYLTDAPPALVRWNGLWLFSIVLIPFVTKVLTEGSSDEPSFPYRFGLYAVVQVLSGVATLMAARVMGREGVVDLEAPGDLLAHSRRRTFAFLVPFALSIPLAFVLHAWAYVVWGLGPWLTATVLRALARRRARS
ncbi:TMEM175 family protein [Lapillicoccus jejuensis]|nr:TMEM175 family protein [Lapillicoccus jejuensis]